MATLCSEGDTIAVFRFDISHFKQVNDEFGFDVGDNVIVACYNIINANIKKYLNQAALGRAHGDEFIVFARAIKVDIEKAIQAIINDMKSYDFSSIGCKKEVGCYIGGLTGQQKTVAGIRKMVEASIEVIIQARAKGPNSYVIQG